MAFCAGVKQSKLKSKPFLLLIDLNNKKERKLCHKLLILDIIDQNVYNWKLYT